MTAPDVRTAAAAEACKQTIAPNIIDPLPEDHQTVGWRLGFVHGAEWGAALVTPTRRQLVDALAVEFHEGDPQSAADAVLALMEELAKGTK